MTTLSRPVPRSAAATDAGMVRTENEDALLERPEIGLWAVADGMGGHDDGALASRSIVEALAEIAPPTGPSAFLAEVESRLAAVNTRLREIAAARGPDVTIGSTVVVLLAVDGHYACLWAGDSRLYLLRGGRLEQVSRDHSVVQTLVDLGAVAPADAAHHPKGNLITRAVGVADSFALDLRQGPTLPGDVFLLCSDGLNKMLPDDAIAAVLTEAPPLEAPGRLVEIANARGALDNLTVIVVELPQEEDGV